MSLWADETDNPDWPWPESALAKFKRTWQRRWRMLFGCTRGVHRNYIVLPGGRKAKIAFCLDCHRDTE